MAIHLTVLISIRQVRCEPSKRCSYYAVFGKLEEENFVVHRVESLFEVEKYAYVNFAFVDVRKPRICYVK